MVTITWTENDANGEEIARHQIAAENRLTAYFIKSHPMVDKESIRVYCNGVCLNTQIFAPGAQKDKADYTTFVSG